VVVYLAGFQPAVDETVAANAGHRALNVADAARLDLTLPAGGGRDPHFWLDPTRYAKSSPRSQPAWRPKTRPTPDLQGQCGPFVEELTTLDTEFTAA